MSSPFLAEIRIFGGPYAPVSWASCDGQLMNISQNPALYSLIGTYFGGDGARTFGLPNFAGNAPVGAGAGAALTPRSLGERGGTTAVALNMATMASHNHPMNSRPRDGQTGVAASDTSLATVSGDASAYQDNTTSSLTALTQATTMPLVGGNGPHNNLQPYLALFFIICLNGIFPQRP